MPKHLTEAQVRDYEKNGFVFPMTAFGAAEADAARETIEAFERDTGLSAMEALAPYAHRPFRHLSEIIRHPRILDAVEDLIGPDILCWGSAMFVKEPHDPKFVSWHADTYYYGLEPAETCTAWLAFTPSNELSGCIHVLPGSHLAEMPFDEAPDADNILVRGQTTRGVDAAETVAMPLDPGQFSIHHERVVHGSAPNRSDWRRMGYSIHYCAPSVRQVRYAGEAAKPAAALVRGEDAYGYWDHEPMQDKAFDPAALDALLEARRRFLARGRG